MVARLTPRRLMGVAIAALLMLLLVPLAVAQAPDGRLQVNGNGTVATDGQMVLIGAASDRGRAVLQVRDYVGDAQVTVNGQRQTPRGGQFVVRQNGRFLVSGSRIGVKVSGRSVNLSIAGTGKVRLSGRGTFNVPGGVVQSWNDGRNLQLGAAASRSGNGSGNAKPTDAKRYNGKAKNDRARAAR